MNIKPIGERLIVKPIQGPDTIGGIIIPDTAKEKPHKGIVESLGQLENGKEWPISEGDTVMYDQNAGHEFEQGDEKYLILQKRDLWLKY